MFYYIHLSLLCCTLLSLGYVASSVSAKLGPQHVSLCAVLHTTIIGLCFIFSPGKIRFTSLFSCGTGCWQHVQIVYYNAVLYVSTDKAVTPSPSCSWMLTSECCLQDPLADSNQASTIALDIRKRKGLKPNPSPLNEYEDKL